MNAVLGTSVKKYLQGNKPPGRALLVMGKVPGVEDNLLEELGLITVKFLLPHTAPLLQPMDQQVISSFKNLSTKGPFSRDVLK